MKWSATRPAADASLTMVHSPVHCNRAPEAASWNQSLSPNESATAALGKVEVWRVAVGRTYLLPPLSSGGASLFQPWLRLHTPLIGRVEDWRAGWADICRPCHVSRPLHVERNVRISRIALPHSLHVEAYGTYPAGATFGPLRRTR